MQTCTKCGISKALTEYNKCKATKTGCVQVCKQCRAEAYTANSQPTKDRAKKWRLLNKEKKLAQNRVWKQNNLAYYAAKEQERRGKKFNATVTWDIELTDFVAQEAQKLRSLREEITKTPWDVDHIIPLQHKQICGLHVWNNLQVIPKKVNIKKSNRSCDEYRWSEFFQAC